MSNNTNTGTDWGDTATQQAAIGAVDKIAKTMAAISAAGVWREVKGGQLTTPIDKGGSLKAANTYDFPSFDEQKTAPATETSGIGPLKDGDKYARDLEKSKKKKKKKTAVYGDSYTA